MDRKSPREAHPMKHTQMQSQKGSTQMRLYWSMSMKLRESVCRSSADTGIAEFLDGVVLISLMAEFPQNICVKVEKNGVLRVPK